LWDWYKHLANVKPAPVISPAIVETLVDDLNTPQMIVELHGMHRRGEAAALRSALKLVGFSGEPSNLLRRQVIEAEGGQYRVGGAQAVVRIGRKIDPLEVEKRIADRDDARKAKNFKESDRIRDELAAMGVLLKDTKDGTTWEIAR
jgi:cysteinyl-tRNA synthetase